MSTFENNSSPGALPLVGRTIGNIAAAVLKRDGSSVSELVQWSLPDGRSVADFRLQCVRFVTDLPFNVATGLLLIFNNPYFKFMPLI